MRTLGYQIFILLIAFLSIIVSVQAQEEFVYGVTIHEDGASEGYVLFAPTQGNSVYLVDYQGHVVKQWNSEHQVFTAYLLPNGHVLMATMDGLFMGATGRIEEYDWDGNLVWTFIYPDLHHDLELLPNGNILMLVWERFTPDEALAMGLNPEYLSQDPKTEQFDGFDGIFLDSIIEVNPTTNEIVWSWAVKDHLIQDYDATAPNFGIVSDYPEKINLNYAWRLFIDRVHFNAIDYNANRDEILVSSRYFSEVWIIDHSLSTEESATEQGDLLYRFGNPRSYRDGGRAGRQLYLQHDAHWLSDNLVLAFNNGQAHIRPFSTVESFLLPINEQGQYEMEGDKFALPMRQLLYRDEPRTNLFAGTLSGASLLPNEHLLITDGPKGRIFEVDADGNIVWEYLVPIFQLNHPNTRSAIFKARFYAIDDPIFFGHELSSGDVIPLTIVQHP